MTVIHLQTAINAPINLCFDLSRNIDIHQLSTRQTNERAVAGKTSGLIENGDFVTWEAVHFGVKQRLSVVVTAMTYPTYFCDEMTHGAFKSMWHQHFFTEINAGKTLMRDEFTYESPFGLIGAIFDKLILRKYMTRFLNQRNQILKEVAESVSTKVL